MDYTASDSSKSLIDYVSFIFGLFGKKKDTNEEKLNVEESTNDKNIILSSPIKGELIQLENLSDAAFASGALGKGVGINPEVGKVCSPIDGVVSTIFPTKHAVAVLSNEGVEILIHIGIDTVNLGGKFFTSHVSDGDKITKGQLLVEFDIEGIKSEGYTLETPIVVTNADNYKELKVIGQKQINESEDLILIK